MTRHRTDLFSLICGLVFLAVVAWWATDRFLPVTLTLPHPGWIVAGVLILLGLLGLVASLRSERTPPTE